MCYVMLGGLVNENAYYPVSAFTVKYIPALREEEMNHRI